MKREFLCALALAHLGALPAGADTGVVPVYTEDDLARVHARRAETGVLSAPAFAPAAVITPSADGHGEAYWRRETEKLGVELRPLQREADALRSKIAAAKEQAAEPPLRVPSPRSSSRARGSSSRSHSTVLVEPRTADTRALEDRLHAIERELAERRQVFEERARRESALPGWIR